MGKLRFIVFLFTVVLFASCKKDLLHYQKVQQLNSNTGAQLNNIRFINDSVCIAAGGVTFDQSVIVRSLDGGYTWTAFSDPDAPKVMNGMGIATDGTIYLCGVDGDVLHSKDAGNTWQFNRINDWLVYKGGTFPTPDTGIFVSTILQRQCTITRVDANFNIIDEQTFLFGLNNIYMTSADKGFVIGYGTVMATTDRGNNWAFQDVKGDNFTAMDIHGAEIWMCGSNGGVYHTYDAGKSWKTLRDGNDITQARYMLRSIAFKDNMDGWACGDDGVVLYSNDGGNHWMEYDRFTTSTLRSIALCPNGDLLLAGDGGALYRIVPGRY
jgi:photosystem II stability/assembly factor-like uncharacterized protein